MNSVPLWLTDEQSCSYLSDRASRSVVVQPGPQLDNQLYGQLIDLGFRRSGDHVYRPHCAGCAACIATRIDVNQFQPSRAQRRCWQRHQSDTRVVIKPKRYEEAHFALYRHYQQARHRSADEPLHSAEAYWQFIGSDWCDTVLVEFHREHLFAVAAVDRVQHGLSAVYTFFDPHFADFSPGVLAVLWQIEHARQLGLDYVYLGFWVEQCRKMRYKIQYQPLQGLVDQQWQILPSTR